MPDLPDLASLFQRYGIALGVGLLGCAYLWFRQQKKATDPKEQEQIRANNPFELWPAIKFGLLFGIILFISKAAQENFGTGGVFVSSAVAGLTDVDAITLSLSNLAGSAITETAAAQGITLAALANTAVKAFLAAVTGAPSLRRYTLPIFGAMIATGMVVSFAVV
jgi:uncharacterized membrane protein (DUF4010 family)